MSTRPSAPAVAAGLAAVAAAGVLAACGVDNKEAGKSATFTRTTTAVKVTQADLLQTYQRQQAREIARRRAALPRPISGVVQIDGRSPLGISRAVQRRFQQTSNVSVRQRNTSDAAGFRDLCDGKVDIVESTARMSAAQLDRCAENGVELLTDRSGRVRPLQLAAEGIVIATKNEADVGGDCMRRETVRRMFGSGSNITNWSQVGFDDLPLTTTGRGGDTNTFKLFGDLVLGAQGDANINDVRSDYLARASDRSERNEITGSEKMQKLIDDAAKERDRRVRASRGARRRAAARAEAQAARDFLVVIRRENAALKRRKTVLTPAQAKAIDRRNLRRVQALKRQAARNASQAVVNRIVADIRGRLRVQLAAIDTTGVVGFFRFTYYELYEDTLRPLEIWDPVNAQASFESRGIATNRTRISPVSTTRARALVRRPNQVSTTERIRYAPTPTQPGATYEAASGSTVVVPAAGPVNVDKQPSCIFPSRTTVTNGVYPLSVRLLAYVSRASLKRSEVRDYLGYYLLEGQNTVASNRLIPLAEGIRGDQYKIVTGRAIPVQALDTTSPSVNDESTATAIGSEAGTTTTGTSTTTTGSTTTGTTTTGTNGTGTGTTGSTDTTPADATPIITDDTGEAGGSTGGGAVPGVDGAGSRADTNGG